MKKIVFLLVFMLMPVFSHADDYPEKNVKAIVVWSAGGGADTAFRIFTKYFEPHFGADIIVQNVTGGGTSIGYMTAKRARPDGYTLVNIQGDLPKFKPMGTAPLFIEDFDILGGFAFQSPVLIVNDDSPWQTVEEFVEANKKNPGKYTIGVSDIGGVFHQPLVLFMDAAGFKATPITHPGSPQQSAAMIGGHVDAIVSWLRPNLPYLKENKMRILAYWGSERLEEFPNVPTLREKGWDVVWEHPYGLGGPKGLPENVKQHIAQALEKTWEEPGLKKDLNNRGLMLLPLPAEKFRKHMLQVQDNMAKSLELIQE